MVERFKRIYFFMHLRNAVVLFLTHMYMLAKQ